MNTSFFIVTDRGHLIAYRKSENEALELAGESYFEEGNAKLSEIVTDQSGAFPVSGTPGTSAYEDMPLEAELEVRCFRRISAAISALLEKHKPGWWGFAAPAEINGAILDHLPAKVREKISVNLKRDLVNTPRGGLLDFFKAAASQIRE